MTRPRLRTLALALALAIGGATVASAQPGPPPARREKVKQRVRAMRAWILTEELQLDEATAAKLVPTLTRFDDEMARLLMERNQLRRELQAAQNGTDDRKINELIDRLVVNQQARWATEQKRFTELRKLLTAKQAARLLDVLPELDRRILQGLRHRGDVGAPPPGMRPRRRQNPLR